MAAFAYRLPGRQEIDAEPARRYAFCVFRPNASLPLRFARTVLVPFGPLIVAIVLGSSGLAEPVAMLLIRRDGLVLLLADTRPGAAFQSGVLAGFIHG